MDYDTYLSNRLAEYEKADKIMCQCDMCGRDLYEGQECYFICGNYCCQECIDDSKVELDYYDDSLEDCDER